MSIVSLLLISETLQKEGLVKSWLSLILQLIRKRLWERDSIELGVEKHVIEPLHVHIVLYGGWVNYVCYTFKQGN